MVNSNDNTDHIPPDMKYKFVDDLSTLEKLNLLLVGLASYNFRNHVASNIGIDEKFLPSGNIGAQSSLDQIVKWAEGNKMQLNKQKSKVMIFNYTNNFQFSTRLHIKDTLLDIIF